jgi:hypothetical protein
MNDRIRQRVKKFVHGKTFSPSGLCLICGRLFKNEACKHTIDDQYIAIKAVYSEELLR